MKKQPVFEGVCTALVTPFRNGTVDTGMLGKLLDLQMQSGVQAVVLCGTTGESPTLTPDEQIQILQHAIEYTAGKLTIIAGTGCNDTARTLETSRVAASLGADAILVVTPYYNKTTQRGLIEHYTILADEIPCPVIMYNVPSRTGLDIAPDSCRILSEHPNIGGIKEAGGNLSKIQRILDVCGDNLPVWSGNDDQIVPVMSVGGHGVISVLSNLLPKETVRITDLCKSQDYSTAGSLQCKLMPLIDCLFSEVNPIPIKAALNMLGWNVGLPRRPLVDMSEDGKERLKHCLDRFRITSIEA